MTLAEESNLKSFFQDLRFRLLSPLDESRIFITQEITEHLEQPKSVGVVDRLAEVAFAAGNPEGIAATSKLIDMFRSRV